MERIDSHSAEEVMKMEYAFMRDRSIPVLNAADLHAKMAADVPGVVDAVTVVGSALPVVIFVRCKREPTADEVAALRAISEAYSGAGGT
jgi:hypothetical protein